MWFSLVNSHSALPPPFLILLGILASWLAEGDSSQRTFLALRVSWLRFSHHLTIQLAFLLSWFVEDLLIILNPILVYFLAFLHCLAQHWFLPLFRRLDPLRSCNQPCSKLLSTQYSFLPFLHSPSPVPQGLTVVATTFSFFHHPTAAQLPSGTAEWQRLCHVCPHCIFSLHPYLSPPSGVVSVLALPQYMQVLCTNSVFCSVSLKRFPAVAAMRFLHQHNQWGIHSLPWIVLHGFASL